MRRNRVRARDFYGAQLFWIIRKINIAAPVGSK